MPLDERCTAPRSRDANRVSTVLTILVTALLVAAPASVLAAIAVDVAAGGSTSCAVTSTGAARCWGSNTGDGSDLNRLVPVTVAGAASDVAAVDQDQEHGCLLTTGGVARCWGNNSRGQLGDGTTFRSTTPVDVVGLPPLAALGAGFLHTCAVTTTGAAKCWGSNGNGQLGDGTTDDRVTPVDVVGLGSGVAQIAPATGHTCARTDAGAVKCWGGNGTGQLGDGTNATSPTPVDVVGLTGGTLAVISGSQFSCALTAAGGVKCWGWNALGQLGDGSTDDRNAPVDVVGLTSGVAAIGAGANHACAVTTGGAVKCWGRNLGGQIGDGTTSDRSSPVDVLGLASGVVDVDGGADHTCARTAAGGVKCWGRNGVFSPAEATGELGDGTVAASATPVNVVDFGPPICTNGGGEQTLADVPRPRLVLSRIDADPRPFNDRLTLVGQVALPAGVSFAMLDPVTQGARLQIGSAGGTGRVDVTLAAGDFAGVGTRGWRTNASGTVWTFLDRTGEPRNGVVKMQLTDRSRGAPGGNVKLLAIGQNGNYPVVAGDEPLLASLVLGDAAAGAAGRCAETGFLAGDCSFNATQTTVTCRR